MARCEARLPGLPCAKSQISRESELGELFAHELAHDGAVGAPRDLGHDVGHHTAELPEARRPDLGDHVVHDLLELLLGERRRHELFEHGELLLLLERLLLAVAAAEGLRRFDAALALALQDLELLVVRERALKLLLRRAQAGEDEPQRVAPLVVVLEHRVLELLLHAVDQTHARPRILPPRMCQCRWNTVWPAPGPTLTTTL